MKSFLNHYHMHCQRSIILQILNIYTQFIDCFMFNQAASKSLNFQLKFFDISRFQLKMLMLAFVTWYLVTSVQKIYFSTIDTNVLNKTKKNAKD